jgi:hypothetical protein
LALPWLAAGGSLWHIRASRVADAFCGLRELP